MILTNDEDIAKKINSAIFPGIQGGPLMHVIAGKAVAFGEALQPEFKVYAKNVIDNAKAMGEVLVNDGFALVSGGTDTHLILVDLRPKKLTGNISEKALGRAHITCNKNGVPFDPEKPMVTSGIRLGAPAGTTRGFGVAEFQRDRPHDRGGARRPRQERRRRQRRGREQGQGAGDRAVQALPDLRLIARAHFGIARGARGISPAHLVRLVMAGRRLVRSDGDAPSGEASRDRLERRR